MAKVQKLRNNEYYDMQTAMDNLYEESKKGYLLTNLLEWNKYMEKSSALGRNRIMMLPCTRMVTRTGTTLEIEEVNSIYLYSILKEAA